MERGTQVCHWDQYQVSPTRTLYYPDSLPALRQSFSKQSRNQRTRPPALGSPQLRLLLLSKGLTV